MRRRTQVEEGGGNVFASIGFPNSEARLAESRPLDGFSLERFGGIRPSMACWRGLLKHIQNAPYQADLPMFAKFVLPNAEYLPAVPS
jgi:hypothetical protein